MALQMSYTAPDGVAYPECYVRATYILAYPESSSIVTDFYANRQAFDDGAGPVNGALFPAETAVLDGAIFANAYAYLLTLPEFAGAIEVP